MNHIYWYPHSKEAEFYKLLLDYDESLERDLADCRAIWYESWTQNLMVWNYWMPDRIVSMIISKQFWFIEWLVENNKIEWETIWNYQSRTKLRTLTHTAWLWHDAEWKSELEYIKEAFTDGLLMILSISDTPIEDLISYLK